MITGSTIGAGGLNFRVRDGNGCDPAAIATRKGWIGLIGAEGPSKLQSKEQEAAGLLGEGCVITSRSVCFSEERKMVKPSAD